MITIYCKLHYIKVTVFIPSYEYCKIMYISKFSLLEEGGYAMT